MLVMICVLVHDALRLSYPELLVLEAVVVGQYWSFLLYFRGVGYWEA